MAVIYTCAGCGWTGESDWSEAEALAEAEACFPEMDHDDRAIVCDDCFKRMGLG